MINRSSGNQDSQHKKIEDEKTNIQQQLREIERGIELNRR